MEEKGLNNFFEDFLKKEPIIANKRVLQTNYMPDLLLHRDTQINALANVLAPILRLEKPSNLFVFGKTGTGKTVTVKYVLSKINETAKAKDIPINTIYINCKLKKIADTEYRLIAQLCRDLGKEIPITGLPTDEVYKIFYSALEKSETFLVLILDEIDQLVKKTGDELLYNLIRINEELKESQITLIGISNDLLFIDHIDPRVKSSLSEEEVLFPPYNALQLQNILRNRASKAFKEGILTHGVIEKCAAYSAREHGDARRALELLRVAAELCERKNEKKIAIEHIDLAEEKIEKDHLIELIVNQPKQFQLTLFSILNLHKQESSMLLTGEIYELYQNICNKIKLAPLTQRRVSDIISELDMLGLINAKVISKGRYGRTREISLSISDSSISTIKQILGESLNLK